MKKTTITTLASLGLTMGTLLLARPALADVLPPEAQDCTGTNAAPIGGACGLHDSANTKGTCQNTTCSHASPPGACDGGGAGCSSSSPCVLCVAGGGDGGAGGSDGGTSSSSSSGGCSVAGTDTSMLNLLLPLGLASLVPLALRRRKTRKS
jgi:hypothetical protein